MGCCTGLWCRRRRNKQGLQSRGREPVIFYARVRTSCCLQQNNIWLACLWKHCLQSRMSSYHVQKCCSTPWTNETDSLHWGQQSTHFICKPTAEVWAWRVPIPPWLSSGAILRSLPPMFPGESNLFPGSLEAMCSLSWSHISGIQIVFSSWIDWFLLHNLGKTDLKINASNDAQFFNKKAIMLCSYQTENKNSGVQGLTAACSNSTAVVTTLNHNAYKCFLPPTCSLPSHCHKLLT